MVMLCRYAGFDPTECAWKPKAVRGPGSRFSQEQIDSMISMTEEGATSLEIGTALRLKPEAVRAKLNKLGVALRKRVLQWRVRMVVDVTRRMRYAAGIRGITPQQLIRRLLQAISRDNLFDSILPLPVVRAHSLGAAVTYETPTPAESGAGAAAVAGIPSPSAAAAFSVVLNQPRLIGCCARLG